MSDAHDKAQARRGGTTALPQGRRRVVRAQDNETGHRGQPPATPTGAGTRRADAGIPGSRPLPEARGRALRARKPLSSLDAQAVASRQRPGQPLALLAWTCLSPAELEALAREYRRVARRLNRQRGPGRPCGGTITEALQLHLEGRRWSEIYRRLKIPPAEQHLVRDAVRQRKFRERRRQRDKSGKAK